MSVAAYATARQSSESDCHHSREPFDTLFHCVTERRDISPSAKLVHARLVSLHRLGRDETQTEIGEHLGLSRHQVWQAIQELIGSGLVVTIRYGLGRPNSYVLVGIDADSLKGRAGRQQAAGSGRASRARTSFPKKDVARTGGYRVPEASAWTQTRTGTIQRR